MLYLTLLIFCYCYSAFAFKLPDTGQTTCYRVSGIYMNPINCSGTGQDGAHTMNPMSYTDNGDGTVTDNVTSIIWQKKDNGLGGSQDYAASYCQNLTLGGHSGWRLPTRLELMSLMNYGTPQENTMRSTTYFTDASKCGWSSTTDAEYYDVKYWIANYTNGSIYSLSSAIYSDIAQCVFGPQESPSFHNNGDSTVTDGSTGLMWQQTEGGLMPWTNAISYCQDLNFAGYVDWRLPNVKELESINDNVKYNPEIDTYFFPNAGSNPYWSSTPVAIPPGDVPGDNIITANAWIVSFYDGEVWLDTDTTNHYVRCVRDGQSGPLPPLNNFTLTVSRAGTGGGGVATNTGTLIWSGNTSTASYSSGTSVTLTATADSYSTFTSWSGCDSTSGDTCTVSMTAAKNVTVTFDETTSCAYQIEPTIQVFTASGGSDTVNITTSPGCSWTLSNTLPWVTITSGSSGTGAGTVNYSVSTDFGEYAQTGTITVAGQTFTVIQENPHTDIFIGMPGNTANSNYTTIQSGYNTALAVDNIHIQSGTYTENDNFDRNVTVDITGGYNANFTILGANSVINGSMTISNGTVIVSNITIQ